MTADEPPNEPEIGQARPISPRRQAENFVRSVIIMEGAILVVAIVLGWIFGVSPWQSASWTAKDPVAAGWAVGIGVVATLPLIAFFFFLRFDKSVASVELQRLMETQIVPQFSGATLLELGAVAFAAGLCEEALFRGFLQSGLTQILPDPLGGAATAILIVSILFGLAHFLSPEYAAAATTMGCYFGLLFYWTDDLITPITTHFLYDWFALVYMRNEAAPSPDDE
ncbi:CPBP family intramembrane metalloprotease [Blastopirellula sp. JC732]|uniref:CPBP family intramembrane metalloprotease n=1 Tax=Blastopirellula sediminis TaxID=2894196 RepID=A0A9X1SDN3_9BACT|nr:CPBP family intramembrane glutamic endopeptidase [Blastopirellula sediminis]MCC9604325.1 CPBP family intramembrane metalloprotease [Blastopirellula sediminis]MCC9626845.1 CPBP family intramembrane metalloprotease [Blastopirellula sediminis]